MLLAIAVVLVGASKSFDLCPSPDFSLLGDESAQIVIQKVEPVTPQVVTQQVSPVPAAPVYYYASPVVTKRVNARLFRSSAFGACTTGNCR